MSQNLSSISIVPLKINRVQARFACLRCHLCHLSRRGVNISLRSSNLILDSSFDTYMPIFVSLRLANSSINSDKQTKKTKKNPSILIYKTSTLRLLALRGLRTLRVRRVALRVPGVTQSNIFWDFFLYINILNKCQRKISHMDPKI